MSYPISIALRLFSYLTWSLLTYQLGTGGAALPLPHSAAGHGLRLRRPLLAAAAPLGRRRLPLLGAEPDEVQLGRQLERVQRPLEEHGVEYLEGAAPGQRQQGEVKTRRLAGLGGNSIGVKNSPNISAKSQIEQDSSINCFKNYRVTTVVWHKLSIQGQYRMVVVHWPRIESLSQTTMAWSPCILPASKRVKMAQKIIQKVPK